MRTWEKIKERIKRAPKTPGVYIFLENKKILYIGKASNLKNRLQSYLKTGDYKNDRLHENATSLKLIPLRSEIEALIEEAKLIKKYNPPYNVIWRDDKTYFYAVITKEKFPRIFVAHKNGLEIRNSKLEILRIGLFTEGRALRLVLKMLRRYFPYCTCPKPHLRICLNTQIGNCCGFCCIARRSTKAEAGIARRSVNAEEGRKDAEYTPAQIKRYKKNIRIIKNFLLGKPLKNFAKNLDEEEKAALEKILQHREFLENFDAVSTNYSLPTTNYLVECFDISHLSGKETVAGMTAWEFAGGKLYPRKDFYRKFIIRTVKPGDDPAAMFEAISRRLNHSEWPYPNLIVIDGGIGQFSAAKKAFVEFELTSKINPPTQNGADNSSSSKRGRWIFKKGEIKIISFAKPEQMVYGLKETPTKIGNAPADIQKIIPTVISRTHDYAIRFHRQRRKKNFLPA